MTGTPCRARIHGPDEDQSNYKTHGLVLGNSPRLSQFDWSWSGSQISKLVFWIEPIGFDPWIPAVEKTEFQSPLHQSLHLQILPFASSYRAFHWPLL